MTFEENAIARRQANDREDAARLEGFADCESLLILMLNADADKEFAEAITHPVNSYWANRANARGEVLRQKAKEVSEGLYRTDAYDPDLLLQAHRRAVNRSQASAGGKAAASKLTPEERKQRGKDAVEARWTKVKKEKGETK